LEQKLTSEQLIKQCRKGNALAQYQLYEQYADAMYNIAFRITGNQPDAEDALQEAFVKAFRKIGSFKGEATPGAWLKRIVVNQCLGDLRKKKVVFEPINDERINEQKEENEPAIDEKIPMHKVMDAIEELPDGARVVFTLKAIEEYKFKEIATMLNQTETNCKVQYHRSKKILSKKLEGILQT